MLRRMFWRVLLLAVCAAPGTSAHAAEAYQVSTISSLLAGGYDGATTIGEMLRHGNFGLGTFNGVDGEMIVLDGQVYRATIDGRAHLVEPSELTPFAVVVPFQPQSSIAVAAGQSLDQLEAALDALPYSASCRSLSCSSSTRRCRSAPIRSSSAEHGHAGLPARVGGSWRGGASRSACGPPVTEFMKAGGGVRCLTLALDVTLGARRPPDRALLSGDLSRSTPGDFCRYRELGPGAGPTARASKHLVSMRRGGCVSRWHRLKRDRTCHVRTPRPWPSKTAAQAAEAAAAKAPAKNEVAEDADELLDEIDALLEEQSVLTNFRQKKGGR